jgi:hypothetical protein
MRSPRYVPQRLEGVSCKETSRGLTIHFKAVRNSLPDDDT